MDSDYLQRLFWGEIYNCGLDHCASEAVNYKLILTLSTGEKFKWKSTWSSYTVVCKWLEQTGSQGRGMFQHWGCHFKSRIQCQHCTAWYYCVYRYGHGGPPWDVYMPNEPSISSQLYLLETYCHKVKNSFILTLGKMSNRNSLFPNNCSSFSGWTQISLTIVHQCTKLSREIELIMHKCRHIIILL